MDRFIVDNMLLKLGKYLRILGYDAEWNAEMTTHDLIRLANEEQKIFLSRNTRLQDEYPPVNTVVLIKSTDPVEQLAQVVNELGLDAESGLFTKCIKCNVFLDEVSEKIEIKDRVHPNVYACYENFFTCPRCGTVFWKGSHVRNTLKKLQSSVSVKK